MGLICSSRLLVSTKSKTQLINTNDVQALAPALIESIKTAGLVLVADITDSPEDGSGQSKPAVARPRQQATPDGVDGYLRGNGVLCFNETVDM
jgi:CDK inhibitor PHO81